MEYLGFGVTRDGVKPINIKMEEINNIKPPTSRKKVQKLVGVLNYYRNMWPSGSHTVASLTIMTSEKSKFQ